MLINIYLTDNERNKMNELQQKYKVSYSTIANCVLFYFTKYLLAEKKENEIIKLNNENYYSYTDCKKTSIKPQGKDNQENVIYGLHTHLNRAFTNSLKIYLNKDIKKYLCEKNVNMFYQELNTKLQKTTEPNYNFNHIIKEARKSFSLNVWYL